MALSFIRSHAYPPTNDWVYDFEIEAKNKFRENELMPNTRCYGPNNEFVPPNYKISPCCSMSEFNSTTRTCTPSAQSDFQCAVTNGFAGGQDRMRTLETEYIDSVGNTSLFDGAKCTQDNNGVFVVQPAGRAVFASVRYK